MKGQLQKTIESSHLACVQCSYFREDDPDLYYCEHQREEFPNLCEKYLSRVALTNLQQKWSPVR